MRETWSLLDSGFKDAATNMATDEALLQWHSKGEIPPTIRFYGWNRPSLSIGYFQNIKKTIDLNGVDKHQCEVVRRLTGGSAVLHDKEITYSIIVSEKHQKIPASVNEAYYVLSQGLLEGYHQLGVKADFSIPEHELKRERSAVCFEVPAIYEMVVDGKKISGNAQTRKQGVLLQHGSIPFEFDADMLFDLFLFSSEDKRQQQKLSFKSKATSINDITGRLHSYDVMRDAFLQGFQESLQIDTEVMTLSKEQEQYIDYLATTKYRTQTWNESKNKTSRSM